MIPTPLSRVTVIGDGAMGTVCALLLASRGTQVTLWGRSKDHIAQLEADRENKCYLPGFPFPKNLRVVSKAGQAFSGSGPDLIVSAVPCQFMRSVWMGLSEVTPKRLPIVSVSKGIEIDTLLTPTEIISDCLSDVRVACLSGPCIAPEMAARHPTSVVVASAHQQDATLIQEGFSTDYFRVYTNPDLMGVEVAGAVKNVIAIAAGISDGLGLGDNAKAALVTRGLVEITRLGLAMKASPETFAGLAGVGDLVTTCISKIGRNRSAGQRIGQGESAQTVIETTKSVIEGIPTTKAVLELAQKHHVELPIVAGMATVLFENVAPSDALRKLMTRPLRKEQSW